MSQLSSYSILEEGIVNRATLHGGLFFGWLRNTLPYLNRPTISDLPPKIRDREIYSVDTTISTVLSRQPLGSRPRSVLLQIFLALGRLSALRACKPIVSPIPWPFLRQVTRRASPSPLFHLPHS